MQIVLHPDVAADLKTRQGLKHCLYLLCGSRPSVAADLKTRQGLKLEEKTSLAEWSRVAADLKTRQGLKRLRMKKVIAILMALQRT